MTYRAPNGSVRVYRANSHQYSFTTLVIIAFAIAFAACSPAPAPAALSALPPPTPVVSAATAPVEAAAPGATTAPVATLAPAGVVAEAASAGAWIPPARTKTTGCLSQGGLPDTGCTPGAVDSRVNEANIATTICRAGYTRTVRPPVSVTDRIKRDQMAAYGLVGVRLADDELDHLISLELGGAPSDVANLWPEPWNGNGNAHQKDAVENLLHEQVCRGLVPLADAQRQIATDWRSVYTGRGLQPATATPTD